MNTQCPICASRNLAAFSDALPPGLFICKRCRHIFWREFPSEAELTKYYEQQYTDSHNQASLQEGGRAFYRGHVGDLAFMLGKPISEVAYLDFGCSYPVFLEEARALGARRVVGVEPAQQVAKEGIEIFAPDQLDQIGQGSIDAIRFSHVLEHLREPLVVLQGALELVRPGGIVHITQPSFPLLKARKCSQSIKDAVYPEHLHFFSPLSLALMCDRCNLKLLKLFTHQNEEAVLTHFKDCLDSMGCKLRMRKYRQFGEPGLTKGNCPFYGGENSAVYAYKK